MMKMLLTGLGVPTTDHAIVAANIKFVTVDERRLHVGAVTSVRPNQVLTIGFDRHLAHRVFRDREDARRPAVRCRQEHEAMPNNRRRHGDIAGALQLPKLFAGIKVIATHVFPAIQDQLATFTRDVHRRRAPSRLFLTRRAPHLLACLDVKRGAKTVLLHIALHVDTSVVNHRRTRPPPLRIGRSEVTGVEHAKVLLPQELAIDGVDVQAFTTEERCDVGSVRSRSRCGVRAFRMPLDRRHAMKRNLRPQHFAVGLIQAQQAQLVLRLILNRSNLAIEANPQLRIATAIFDRGVDEHPFAPNHDRRM